MRVMVTGGAGYIGSHLVLELLQGGHDVVVVDDFSTGYRVALDRVQALAGRSCEVVATSVADVDCVTQALRGADAVMHLAAFKAVGESMDRPERYFHNNVGGMSSLLQAMRNADVRRIVYSSTAAVYGTQDTMPIAEDAVLRPGNPYALSKAQGEEMLDWMVGSHGWSAVSLRYFNPVGAHPSGHIGEHAPTASNLVPRVLMAIRGELPSLELYGTDYDTPDGTCLRDYIHVCDLARAHLAAIQLLDAPGHQRFNVGTGRAYSVAEVVDTCERITQRPVKVVQGARRPGDAPVALADPRRFHEAVGFRAGLGIEEMVGSAWRWSLLNPAGYAEGQTREALRLAESLAHTG